MFIGDTLDDDVEKERCRIAVADDGRDGSLEVLVWSRDSRDEFENDDDAFSDDEDEDELLELSLFDDSNRLFLSKSKLCI